MMINLLECLVSLRIMISYKFAVLFIVLTFYRTWSIVFLQSAKSVAIVVAVSFNQSPCM